MAEKRSTRFLADESCDFSVVRRLREMGYDVQAVVEATPGASDESVIDLARAEQRILLTENRDFGRLVFASNRATSGVIFVRFPADRRRDLANRVLEVIERHADKLQISFTVVTPDHVRVTSLP